MALKLQPGQWSLRVQLRRQRVQLRRQSQVTREQWVEAGIHNLSNTLGVSFEQAHLQEDSRIC